MFVWCIVPWLWINLRAYPASHPEEYYTIVTFLIFSQEKHLTKISQILTLYVLFINCHSFFLLFRKEKLGLWFIVKLGFTGSDSELRRHIMQTMVNLKILRYIKKNVYYNKKNQSFLLYNWSFISHLVRWKIVLMAGKSI